MATMHECWKRLPTDLCIQVMKMTNQLEYVEKRKSEMRDILKTQATSPTFLNTLKYYSAKQLYDDQEHILGSLQNCQCCTRHQYGKKWQDHPISWADRKECYNEHYGCMDDRCEVCWEKFRNEFQDDWDCPCKCRHVYRVVNEIILEEEYWKNSEISERSNGLG